MSLPLIQDCCAASNQVALTLALLFILWPKKISLSICDKVKLRLCRRRRTKRKCFMALICGHASRLSVSRMDAGDVKKQVKEKSMDCVKDQKD